MGRLFWKFFLFLWLAQLVAMAGVSTAVWLSHADRFHAEQNGHRPMPPDFVRDGPPGAFQAKRPFPHGGPPPRLEMLAWPLLAGSIASLLVAALLAWYFSKPIRSLRDAFQAVSKGRLDTRIGMAMAKRNDELSDLGSSFDDMADRLQQLVETQRRLLHDVSHELRSPLARLQAISDLMRQQPGRAEEFITRIERDTGRMDVLIGELLTLARLDAGMKGEAEIFDLVEVLLEIEEDAGFEARGKGCRIEVSHDEHLPVRGDRVLLHRAIENVVRNAVGYTVEGTHIDIRAHAEDGRLRLLVADQGPGVFDEDLDAIFAPFFRSRSRSSAEGYGLGLAISRRVAQSHGGSVSASNRIEGGLLVTIDLPLV